MSQVVTKRVVLYSTASSEHPYRISNNNEEVLLKTETLSSDTNKAIELDVGTNQGSEIVFNVQSDGEPTASKTFVTTTTSRKVIRTYVTDTGEPQQLTIQTNPVVSTSVEVEKHGNQVQNDTNVKNIFETELQSQHKEPKNRASSKIQMESPAYVSTMTDQQHITATNEKVNEKNSQSTNSSKTSNPRTSIGSSYTYRVKDGVAILENVTKYRSQKRTKKERSEPQQTITYTGYQQVDGNQTNQSILTQTEPLEKTLKAFPNEEKIENESGNYERETHTWPREDTKTPHNKKDNAQTLQNKLKFIPLKYTQEETEEPRYNSKQQLQNISEKATTICPQHTYVTYAHHLHQNQDTKPSKSLARSSPSRLLIPDFNPHRSTQEVKEPTPPPTKLAKGKPEEWITQVATQEEVRSEPPLQAKRLSADKVQFLHSQDTQPVKKLDASSPGRLVIPDFNQHSSTIEVKELSPPPTKLEKRKPEGWITQVATQEEVRSEPPLQANRLSADKVQFLHSQDTQPVKKLDASSPGRLVIPDFNHHSSTIEVKELSPPPTKLEKRKPEEWITQVATQEEVRSEPPLQSNRLSADKVQFLHNQDTQPVKKLDASSPGRLVIPDFNQHSSTIEVKELSPPPTNLEKRKPEGWITQVATQEEVRSEPPLQANRLSADKVQFLHSQDTQPVKKLDASSPGRLVIPDFNQHSSTIEVKELSPPPTNLEKRKPEGWITQVATQEEVRSEPPLQANRLSADRLAFLLFCWRWAKFFDLYGGTVLIKVRNDKSARRGSIELFNRLCVLAVKKLHFVC